MNNNPHHLRYIGMCFSGVVGLLALLGTWQCISPIGGGWEQVLKSSKSLVHPLNLGSCHRLLLAGASLTLSHLTTHSSSLAFFLFPLPSLSPGRLHYFLIIREIQKQIVHVSTRYRLRS